MPLTESSSTRALREERVNAHVQAVTTGHDVDAVMATFHRARYEVPALGVVTDGVEASGRLLSAIFAAFPDFYITVDALHHADDAVIAEVRFGGTQRGVWAGVEPKGAKAEVAGVLIFVFEGQDDLVGEKVYFDHGTILRQLAAGA